MDQDCRPDPRPHLPLLLTHLRTRSLGISVRHLTRIFESTGRSPVRHIMERRLVEAHGELTDPGTRQTTIADVAHRWGFSSQTHFARHFRARFGMTPSAARRESTGRPTPYTGSVVAQSCVTHRKCRASPAPARPRGSGQ
ncbi:helix-turn-helix transcriptional regulator [Streptomyces sp. NPDC057474]|uniref:helix-turn-helix transcriptional regulator n=1 Tax=Streptomyces sp. NPDC057474 TaxID=3346144 RepID=UPI0036987FF8